MVPACLKPTLMRMVCVCRLKYLQVHSLLSCQLNSAQLRQLLMGSFEQIYDYNMYIRTAESPLAAARRRWVRLEL